MLIAAARATAPVLLRRPSTVFWVAVVAVDRCHQTGLDSDPFLQQHVHHRGEAVRGAGGVRHDVVAGPGRTRSR